MNRLLLIIIIFISCENNKGEFKLLEYQSYKSHIENNSVQLFDVRTPEEYNLGHINGAVNIDFKNEEIFYRSFEKLDKSKPVYLYCRSGNRSKKSADILIELGFSKVYDLKGGFIEWNLNELK
jgi:rhodanese-related sulfurtransferase